MAQKPKAGSAPKKAKPGSTPKAKDEKQFERFIETARELGVDESGADFEKSFKNIVHSKRGVK